VCRILATVSLKKYGELYVCDVISSDPSNTAEYNGKLTYVA